MPLVLHFLNVGHGDCTVIEFPSGRVAMIDINNSRSLPQADKVALAEHERVSLVTFTETKVFKGERSWSDYYESLLVDPVEFWLERFGRGEPFRYVQSHPDMDHMTGLHRLVVQEGIRPLNFWGTANTKVIAASSWAKSPHDKRDWDAYCARRASTATPKVLDLTAGDEGSYWREDHVEVLGPTAALIDWCNSTCESWNNASYVLRIEHAGRRVILPGDAESREWQELLAAHGAAGLDCDLLKAAHHGRESGFDDDAVAAMAPSVVICSVGEKPETDASDQYRATGAMVLSTRYNGTITATIHDDGVVTIVDRNGKSIASIPKAAAA